jgi:hypothetical protein
MVIVRARADKFDEDAEVRGVLQPIAVLEHGSLDHPEILVMLALPA